jgi:hypothetical protein
MRNYLVAAMVLCCCAMAYAQAAGRDQDKNQDKGEKQAPAPQDLAADLGFRYDLPQGWTIIAAKPASQAIYGVPPDAAITEEQKKGTACIQISLTAMHGEPASVIVIVGLPFDCYGQTMSAPDLAGFGAGVAEGLKQVFDISAPVTGKYALGTHPFWIERARGNPKGHPEVPYTVETACSLLKKGVVCWTAATADADSLKAFEQAPVGLEGDEPTALVPDSVFAKPAP